MDTFVNHTNHAVSARTDIFSYFDSQLSVCLLRSLLKRFLVSERGELIANSVRLTSIGTTRGVSKDVQKELQLSQTLTAGNNGLSLCLALNYGSHDEILDAARRLARQAADG